MMVANDIAHDTRVKKGRCARARWPAGHPARRHVRHPRGPGSATCASCGCRSAARPGHRRPSGTGPAPVPPAPGQRRPGRPRHRAGAGRERDLPARPAWLRARERDGGNDVVYRAGVAGRRARRAWLRLRRYERRARKALAWRLNNRIGQAWREHDLTARRPRASPGSRAPPGARRRGRVRTSAGAWRRTSCTPTTSTWSASPAGRRPPPRGRRPAAWVYDAHEYVAGLSHYGVARARVRGYLDLEPDFIRAPTPSSRSPRRSRRRCGATTTRGSRLS